jgi:fluoride exporter
MVRYAVSGFVGRRIGETFPWGTLAVNGTGALAIGLIAGWLAQPGVFPYGEEIWIAATTGVLGSYTTVSSFSLQTLALLREAEWQLAILNILGSLAVCLVSVAAGFVAGDRLLAG